MSSNMAAVPMSFAKVAASGGKENVALNSFARTGAPARDTRTVSVHEDIEPGNQTNVSTVKDRNPAIVDNTPAAQQASAGETNLVDAVKALTIHNVTPSLVVNGSSGNSGTGRKVEVAEVFSEDPFQRTDSGSDLGTKPPSLDGKSITSGTTFALDEKESLRPDDSASVKAAEDDDTFSGRGSIVAGSRIGSEAAARAYRSQFVYESSERRNMLPMQESQGQGAITPQSGSSGQQVAEDVKNKPHVGAPGTSEAFGLFYRQTPDEKLLEALESPKDRIFLLRLEQDVIEFVKDSKEPFIDLPPCNSFCRMLTHKLADYYHMTHQVDAVAGAVRIFRTPFCRIPPPLTSISNPPTTGNTPPPSMPAMKIMRRGGDGDTGTNASKANSETGSDGKDKSLSAKEKLSREEREAAYNKARERIFGKEEKTGDATPETEDGNEMSRSSSVSNKDRSGQPNKRGKSGKQRRDDDSFETRSLYTPVFPQQQQQQQAAWAPVTQYAPMGPQQFVPPYPNSYMGPMPTQYGLPPQQFNPTMISGNMQPYSNITQYPQPTHQQPNQQRYQPQSAPGTTFASPTHSPQPPSQQWQQPLNGYPNTFQHRAVMTGPGTQGTIPYAFGQLPSTANSADPKSQHPIPGSFNRHAFNPKTQSFVPGNTGLPVQQPMVHHGSPHHGSPHHGSPHLSYNNYAPPQQQFSNGQQFGNGMGYNMARQGSNSSVPSYHASPHMSHRQMMHQGMQNMSQGMPQGLPQGMPQNMPQMPQGMQSNVQAVSHLPNFGNPSTLPPKPPPAV